MKNRIVIKNLAAGEYILRIKPLAHDISIQIVKGEYWQANPAYIVSQNSNEFHELSSSLSQNLSVLSADFLPS